MKEIIVSTGDIKQNYQVLKPVFLYHTVKYVKNDYRGIEVERTLDKLIEKFKDKAIEFNGDAILFLKVDIKSKPEDNNQFFISGTLVKFK